MKIPRPHSLLNPDKPAPEEEVKKKAPAKLKDVHFEILLNLVVIEEAKRLETGFIRCTIVYPRGRDLRLLDEYGYVAHTYYGNSQRLDNIILTDEGRSFAHANMPKQIAYEFAWLQWGIRDLEVQEENRVVMEKKVKKLLPETVTVETLVVNHYTGILVWAVRVVDESGEMRYAVSYESEKTRYELGVRNSLTSKIYPRFKIMIAKMMQVLALVEQTPVSSLSIDEFLPVEEEAQNDSAEVTE